MMGMILAERLKMKGTLERKLLVLLPLLVLALAFVSNPALLYGMSVNLWYTFFYFVAMALCCALVNQKEARRLQYRNVYQLPVAPGRVWRAKLYLLLADGALLSNLFGVLLAVGSLLLNGYVENGFFTTLLAVNLVWLLNAWEIPVCLFLAHRGGFYLSFLAGAAFGLIGVLTAVEDCWLLLPVAWADRVMCSVAGYLPNGLQMTEADAGLLLSAGGILLLLAAAAVLFAVLVLLTAAVFEGRQEKC